MYKFHITGYRGICKNDTQFTSDPISATVYAETLTEALDKAEKAMGLYISAVNRKIEIEEIDLSEKIIELKEKAREYEYQKWITEIVRHWTQPYADNQKD